MWHLVDIQCDLLSDFVVDQYRECITAKIVKNQISYIQNLINMHRFDNTFASFNAESSTNGKEFCTIRIHALNLYIVIAILLCMRNRHSNDKFHLGVSYRNR